MRALIHATLLLLLATTAMACATANHIGRHTPREREYKIGKYGGPPEATSGGSIWQDSSRGLFADFRASRVGDVVTIRIDESAKAGGSAASKMSNATSASAGVPNLFGLMSTVARLYPDLDPDILLEVMAEGSFEGSGDTSRLGHARAQIAVRVRETLPNGDLFVEGTKVLLINEEELHIYISGVIRPEDIESDNSIPSSLIADAQIEFTGTGELTQNQKRGWLSRLLSMARPL